MKFKKYIFIFILFCFIIFLPLNVISDDNGGKDNKKDECAQRNCLKTISDIIKSYVIVIDPGHGEKIWVQNKKTKKYSWVYHPGAPSSNNVLDENGHTYKEANIVLDIAKKIRNLINKISNNNITIELTREKDKVKGLGARSRAKKTRTAIINKVKEGNCETTKPFFLSLHLNAAKRDKNEACNKVTYHREFFAFDNSEGNRQPYELRDKFDELGDIVKIFDFEKKFFSSKKPKKMEKNGVLRYGPLCLKEKKVTALDSHGNVIMVCEKNDNNKSNNKDNDKKRNNNNDNEKDNENKKDECKKVKKYIESEYKESIITQHSLSEIEFICNDDVMLNIFKKDYIKMLIPYLYSDYFVSKILDDMFSKVDVIRCLTAIMTGDWPDDNESYSRGVKKGNEGYGVNIRSKVLTSIEFLNPYTIKMLNKIGEKPAVYLRELTKEMVKEHPVLMIPYGSLSFNQNNTSLKETLKQYVQSGGTIVVFAQQYGRHVENIVPIPDGERLKVYGWREDQSCLNGSVYTTGEHPVISSLKSDRASVAVDGYFQSLEAKSPQPKAFVNQRS